MKLSFSLGKPTKPAGAAPPLKRPAAFASLDDEDTQDVAASTSDNKNAAANKKLLAQNVETSRAAKKRMDEELKVDATVYQYDEVWDRMQQVKLRQKESKETDSKIRKPKYIEGLLNSAATRRLDHLRAEEKMLQRERELEGDEFKDKEAFVTQAYRDQMEEVRKAEEEERQREEAEKKQKGASAPGLTHFYRQMLQESEEQHNEAVAAAAKPTIGPQGPSPNLTITKPPDFKPKSDLELAQEARDKGKDVELNDDNQIVDKRDLLSAGLNIAAPNTRHLGLQQPSKTSVKEEVALAHRAVGSAASRKEINERRMREVQRQMAEEQDRLKRQEKEASDGAKRTVARRNEEGDVQSARERYLQRKRRKLEEAATETSDDRSADVS